MAGTFTVTSEQRALDFLFTTNAVTRPTTWYVSLHTGANGGAGASNELSGNGYTRQAVTFSRSNQTMSNTSVLTFGPNTSSNWGTVTDICVWDSVSGGVCLAQGTAAAPASYTVGNSAIMAISALTITLV